MNLMKIALPLTLAAAACGGVDASMEEAETSDAFRIKPVALRAQPERSLFQSLDDQSGTNAVWGFVNTFDVNNRYRRLDMLSAWSMASYQPGSNRIRYSNTHQTVDAASLLEFADRNRRLKIDVICATNVENTVRGRPIKVNMVGVPRSGPLARYKPKTTVDRDHRTVRYTAFGPAPDALGALQTITCQFRKP